MVVGMEIAAVVERVERLAAVDANTAADAAAIEAALVTARQLTGWIEARQASLVARLSAQVSFPEAAIASASKLSIGQASKTCERANTLGRTPRLAAQLDHGAITAFHVDVLTSCSKQLDDQQRTVLFDRVDQLADVAAAANVAEFRRRVELEAKRLQATDGIDRLERQRRNTRLRSWVDGEGMWCLSGRFDPVTGVKLSSKLATAVETMFAEATPPGCPSDAIERQQFLNAHTLARLVDGAQRSGSSTRAEFVVVIDADAPNQRGPVAEFAIPVEIPVRVLADLAGEADVHAVLVRNGVVLHAPGDTDLGRTTRLANRAQRRAMRGLYAGCAIPGCTVGFDRCKLHHIIWWSNGGRTDLANLIPVCSVHHTKIHNDGWIIELGPNRELTLRLPDGSILTTGPPTIRAA
jgi:hypothetical protein